MTATRAGFVGLIGAPNAGKSTLMNSLVGTKVAIVSPKVQTTRARVLGIVMEGDSQLVFVDTPGIFAPKKRLDRAMVAAAWQGAADADIVVLLIDAAHGTIGAESQSIVAKLKKTGRRAVVALNKVDQVRRDRLLGMAADLNAHGDFSDIFMISALTGDGVGDLRRHLAAAVPEGPFLFPPDQLTDLPQRLFAAEITREQIFHKLHQELPYAAAVETESWEPLADGSIRVGQIVYVQRDSQKPIILGKGGRTIKAIGSAARAELEDLLDRRVHLNLFVKVRADWSEDPQHYRMWGLNFDA
ncbi:MAG: GTPase Era [Inquilinaceae bacterium]